MQRRVGTRHLDVTARGGASKQTRERREGTLALALLLHAVLYNCEQA